MPSPLSNQPSPTNIQTSLPNEQHTLSLPPTNTRRAANTVPSPNSANNREFPTPSSASSATTSFQQQEWPLDGGKAPSPSNPFRTTDEIEMDAIAPAGHRRRRSTLTASAGSASGPPPIHPPGRSRAQSIRAGGELGESKIPEEDGAEAVSKPEDLDDGDILSDEDLHDDEETGLTRKDKKRKRAKRRRNTRLDNRIARDKVSDEERKLADQNMARTLSINVVLICLWYLFSLSISLVSLVPIRAVLQMRPCKAYMAVRAADEIPISSIISGCLIRRGSTLRSPFLRHRCTCSCNSPSPVWCYISFHHYGRAPDATQIWVDQGMIRSPTGQPCPNGSI